MLSSPRGLVVGATDIDASAAFLGLLGFTEVRRRGELPAAAAQAIYGLDAPVEEAVLGTPGAPSGTVRIVETPHPASSIGPYDHGAHALDVYSTDLEESLRVLAEAGHRVGPVGLVELGPLRMRQVEVHGPDDLLVVLVDANRRRPTLLDDHPDRLHSEAHSLVWTVGSVDEALPFWRDEAGLAVPFAAPVRHPALSVFMQLPRPDVPLSMAMVCDADVRPMRLEFLEFPEDPGTPAAGGALRGGLHAPDFRVDDLDAAVAALPGASFGEVVAVDSPVHPGARGVRGTAPAGVTFELWQER